MLARGRRGVFVAPFRVVRLPSGPRELPGCKTTPHTPSYWARESCLWRGARTALAPPPHGRQRTLRVQLDPPEVKQFVLVYISEGDVFADLGSGTGKIVLQVRTR